MRILPAPIVVLVALATWGCQRGTVVQAPSAPRSPDVISPAPGSAPYSFDTARSRIDILVYRGGPMARLGHNHVMSVSSLQGQAWIHRDVARSTVRLLFEVADLVVDDPDAREAAGSEFAAEVPEKDRQGTRANMLKPEVLDAERYPTVQMHAIKVRGELPTLSITMAVTLKDVTREIEVPTRVTLEAASLQASGEFVLKQTDFGITPFSVAMGAVQVQDELKVRFDLHGRRTTSQ